MRRYFLLIFALVVAAQMSWGVEPSVTLTSYYAGIDGKATDSNDALRKQLCTIISTGYTSIGYSSLPSSVYAASSDPSDFYNGSSKTMEDIYSSKAYTSSQDGSSATTCGTGWNKEHTVPQSWFNEATPMKSDAHHVFPTDIKMNSTRSSYPYGENNAAKDCANYGYGHLGTSTFEGYTGTVFDPGDGGENGSYKGDLARVYFYMATRYRTTNFTNGTGNTSFTYSNGVADLTPYMKNLMLKWHHEDPVSEKELIRNNAIYAHQNNRNPFVDYPCLVEYIWGEHQGEAVDLSELISGYDGVGTDCCGASASYLVSWRANGTQVATTATRPNDPDDCTSSRAFRGWTGIANYSGNTAPADMFTTGNPTITKDTIFFAVYADKETTGSGEPDNVPMIGEFNGQGTSGDGSEMSATKSGVTLTFSKAYGASSSQVRAYAGGTFTFTSSNPITQISLTTNTSKGSAEDVALSSGGGSYSAEGTSGVWIGSSTEIVFSNTAKQVQFTAITVTAGGATTTYTNFGLMCSASTGGSGLIDLGVDPDYYSAIEGLQDSLLKSTLGKLTYDRFTTRYSYGSGNHNTWHALWSTDRDTTDNSVIDMYSNNKRYFNPNDTTASVSGCDIEHMFPNSWWGAKAGNRDAYEDLHHLVPADYSANRSKSNHGPGVPTDTTFNNGVWVNGADATRDNIVVFCPTDEYKGDFARAFFYIATTYGDTAVWRKEGVTAGHMTNDDWHEFTPAMRELLLTWHRNDPVSDKERVRAHKVYLIQGNRNPFIDYPCLAEYIWGDKQGQTIVLSSLASSYDANFMEEGCTTSTEPNIIKPTNAVYVGITSTDIAITKTINVRGINLTNGNLTLALSGTNASLFSLSTTSISSVNASKGQNVTITYTPTANGDHHATLTISGCGISSYEMALSATCANNYTATWIVEDEQMAQTTAFSGQMPSIPMPPGNCEETRVFVGWTAESSVSDRPADLFVDEAPALTANTTFYAVFADEDKHLDTSGSQTYTFSTNKWAASPTNWISGKNGFSYVSHQGVQVSKSVSGAYASAPTEYTNVTTVTVNYCTNGSTGAGTITMYVGEESITKTVTKEGGTTLRDLEFDFSATHPAGEVVISVECTTNSIYINSVTVAYCDPATYSNYKLICLEVPQYTLTFNNNGDEETITDYAGTKVNVVNAEPCENAKKEYTFVGWGSSQYAEAITTPPSVYASNAIPEITADATYYAVYSYEETTPGVPGAAVGDTLWAEDFSGFSADDVPSSETKGNPTVYGDNSVTYSCTASGTKIYTGTMYAGGESPELLIAKDGGTFSIAGIPTGKATEMTLTFRTNKSTAAYCTVSSSTKNISIGTQTISNKVLTCTITNSANNETLDLTITNTNNSSNSREDDFLLSVKTAGSIPDVTTTYYTTSLVCPEQPTGMEETPMMVTAQKVLIGGQLFIQRDGKLYDARGQRVK